MSLSRFTNALIAIIAIVFILMVTKAYLMPFILALLIWYIIRETRAFLQKNAFIRNRLPVWFQNLLVFVLIFIIIGLATRLLASNIEQFSKILPKYEANVSKINESLVQMFNFNLIESLEQYRGRINFSDLVQPILRGLSSVLGDGFMILLYCAFIILEEGSFHKKFIMIFNSDEQFEQVDEVVEKIDHSFSRYITLKTLISFLTGILSFITLKIIGVDAPVLWAFIIFLLNYIPSIGSLIATAFPTIAAMLQNGEVLPGIWVLLGVGSIQVLVGNVLEPRMMGDSLNVSPLVVIISLVVWGAIWGIVGMVLSVPITVMMIIVFAQFESTRSIAILLSGNGKVEKLVD